ncbi:MAG: Bifunctional phosphoglucose/phosphomannose isomerase [Candidatus Gottesmanbacteria bacterium GW2011_GWA1_34_13]|uniref:Bifunctional phosphoglucose/phosphomannose isomerase n=1 Tax=Candidatus Gottesmanbacteria bacterium GW2011_GWA1_34_13 TaxID=1618434 RepID=A0A0G0B1W7_9BACT|nr:MAG: Bifunctional phosphoglucose/phosphomannose isomerase [Candidatus Gottesmanbacteria bacterium GW2011_GWA1_34_13]
MINIDNLTQIKQLDKENVAGSIEQLGLQCEQAFTESSNIKFPIEYKHVRNIIFSGMGGSALGAYVVKSLFINDITVPFEIINDYHLPKYADAKTLVVASSYSGTTEETVNFLKEAIERKCLTTGLTSGGKLEHLFKKEKIPAYIYLPKYNPSNQPRMALGYPIFGLLAIFNNLGLITVDAKEIDVLKQYIDQGNLQYGLNSPETKNAAKKLAHKWWQKIPVIVSSEHLMHVGRVVRNQLNECAKNFAAYHDVPELNHHLMEGLAHPKSNKENLSFLFINSNNYSFSIKKRMTITEEIVKRNGISTHKLTLNGKTKLSEAIEWIQYGSYVNFYLALLYGVDPSKIPWVDYFKAELSK